MHDCLLPFHDVYRQRTAAALRWKAAGGKVVGYLCDNVPEELVIASGMLPLRVAGMPGQDLNPVRDHVDRLYPPDVAARPAFVYSILASLLSGAYDMLDYLIIPHNRNAIQAIYRQLQDARRERPELRIPELFYLDKAWNPYFVAEAYNRDRVRGLREQLHRWSGQRASDDALSAAIQLCNESRALLREVTQLRTLQPSRLGGVDALAIYGSSMFMPKAEHNALLKRLLANADMLEERQGPRVFIGGSPFDHSGFYKIVEGLGATVVAEDHCWGVRVCDMPVKTSGDPLLALAERFHCRPACSILFPIERTIQSSVERAQRSNANAAIFYVMEGDWIQNWETPDEVNRLRSQSMPVLHLRNQTYAAGVADAGLLQSVSTFLASLPHSPRSPVIAATGAAR
jgi:benzoyl-CoA reductase/2-hydroxyglutaryl-CoA dehydratase subunit BcrC/BadD/HgdB